MDGYIGQLILFAGNFAPRNWAFCNGQLLAISSNSALFSILGTTYGGDGRTTFGLPDLRGRAPIGPGAGPGLSNRTWGQIGGGESNTLTSGNLPNIPIRVSSGNATQDAADNGASIATPGSTAGRIFTSSQGFNKATPDVALNAASAGGNSQALNNMQPFLGTYYVICLFGQYPSRS
ncbi:MAG: microcystin-dependent protein [Patiriisocius sp.]|jgi:microcystin-dependent protein